MRFLLFILLLFSIRPALSAQNDGPADTLQRTADELYGKLPATGPGAAVLAHVDGEIRLHRTYGMASVELATPVVDSTVFDFASLAKMFTGYAVATLVEEGRLALTDPVSDHLPRFRSYRSPVLVGHLLHHTSGVRNWTELLPLAGWDFEDRITTDQILDAVYAQERLAYTPGERYRYSNSGYNLLVAIIEGITEQDFDDWTREHIFEPLGMQATFFRDAEKRIVPNLASGYRLNDQRQDIPEINNLYAPGSSSLFSTVPDMGKWMGFLLDPPADRRPVVERMLETAALNDGEPNTYAYGIEVDTYRGSPFLGHSGSWAGFTSYLGLLPEQATGILIVHNFRTYTRPIMNAFLDAALPASAPPNTKETEERPRADEFAAVALPVTTLEKFVGTYKLGPGWYLEVSREDAQLYVQASGESRFPTKIIGDTTIIVPKYGHRTIDFLTDSLGGVDALFYDGARHPRAGEVNAYVRETAERRAGTYFNHELGLVFELTAGAESLVAHHIKLGAIPLLHTDDDTLTGRGLLRRIKFGAASGRTGFYVIDSEGAERWFFQRAE